MARGNKPAKVDEKGRLKIPADFLDELKEHGSRFYVTSDDGNRAWIYSMSAWGAVEERLAKLPSYGAAKAKFLDRTNYFGQVVEMDAQGRILIPAVLREAAQIKGDVDVLGEPTRLVIWNHERFVDNMNKNPMTDDDRKALADAGL